MSHIRKEKLITNEDSHFVFVGPKAIVGSSGSTWASETVRLRQRNPDNFEIADSLDKLVPLFTILVFFTKI